MSNCHYGVMGYGRWRSTSRNIQDKVTIHLEDRWVPAKGNRNGGVRSGWDDDPAEPRQNHKLLFNKEHQLGQGSRKISCLRLAPEEHAAAMISKAVPLFVISFGLPSRDVQSWRLGYCSVYERSVDQLFFERPQRNKIIPYMYYFSFLLQPHQSSL